MFGEIFVHIERPLESSRNRVDFFVYSPDGNFGVDIYTKTLRDLQKNVNIKIDKYGEFADELYFVVGNEEFTQEAIDVSMASKKKLLPEKTWVTTIDELLTRIASRRAYTDPRTH